MSFGGLQTCPAQAALSVVPVGTTVALECPSNDDNHIFKFWEFGNDQIIGPGNPYDERKYKYEVLSGKLFIKSVRPEESGCYNCYSEHISESSRNVRSVQMMIQAFNTTSYPTGTHMSEKMIYSPAHNSQLEVDSTMDTVKLVAIIVSFIVIFACGIIYVLLRREWNKYDGRMVVPIDDDDEEEGEEIYNRTTTAINPGIAPSRNASSDQLYGGIDNQGLDTDFNSVFEQIQIKSPHQSLI